MKQPIHSTATRQTTGKLDPVLRRTGAVARMLQMPVATLRVWERRYGLTQPKLSPSGQRLYSEAEVQRLALIKHLTDLGHAIGSLAPLDMAHLRRVASTHAQTLAASRTREPANVRAWPASRAWRVAVIGAALGARLQRPALLRRIGVPVVLLGTFDDVAEAAGALGGVNVDALLIHESHLYEGWRASFDMAAPAFAAVQKAVLYGFAADAICEDLASAGTALLRDPQPDAVVAQWLHRLATATPTPQATPDQAGLENGPVPPPRRWDDAALTDFAGLASTVACECPRHVAELLLQLARFETYSAECGSRNAADAELHAYLRQVASGLRARFEGVLEHVALHGGLLLPASRR
jgi:hypothetical protein